MHRQILKRGEAFEYGLAAHPALREDIDRLLKQGYTTIKRGRRSSQLPPYASSVFEQLFAPLIAREGAVDIKLKRATLRDAYRITAVVTTEETYERTTGVDYEGYPIREMSRRRSSTRLFSLFAGIARATSDTM
jgi:hypothetical protein